MNEKLELHIQDEGDFFYREAIKKLRANIQFSGKKNKIIMITSVFSGEGKRTWLNIKASKAFTVALADEAHMDVADFFGIASGNKMNDKFDRTGYHAVKSDRVNAPIIEEFPVTMECELAEIVQTENLHAVVGRIVNTSADEKVLNEKGKDPTTSEIADYADMPEEKVVEIMRVSQDLVSLEAPVGEEEGSHIGDFIKDETQEDPEDAASLSMLKEQLDSALYTLTPREMAVLKLRYGLVDGRNHTLEEVGAEFNVTRERIRQIEAKALRKLRHPSRSKKLRDFLP